MKIDVIYIIISTVGFEMYDVREVNYHSEMNYSISVYLQI